MTQIRKFAPLLYCVIAAVIAFVIHAIIFRLAYPGLESTFHYPILAVYGFFLACSMAILVCLIIIRQRSIDNVGYTFLLLTCVKMGIAYAFLYPAVSANGGNLQSEKIDFFIVFAIFLALETVITVRILNND